MELLLVRHGLPETHVTNDGSRADPDLSPTGVAQAELLGDLLAESPPGAVYSSPMRRAYSTASHVVARIGWAADAIVVREGLSEFDRNDSSYVPMEEMKISNRAAWDQLASGTFSTDTAVVTGFVERVRQNVERIVDDHPGDRVCVVCHGGVINAYLASCLGFDATEFLRFDVDYTSISRVFASSAGHRSVLSVNERTHLRGHPALVKGL